MQYYVLNCTNNGGVLKHAVFQTERVVSHRLPSTSKIMAENLAARSTQSIDLDISKRLLKQLHDRLQMELNTADYFDNDDEHWLAVEVLGRPMDTAMHGWIKAAIRSVLPLPEMSEQSFGDLRAFCQAVTATMIRFEPEFNKLRNDPTAFADKFEAQGAFCFLNFVVPKIRRMRNFVIEPSYRQEQIRTTRRDGYTRTMDALSRRIADAVSFDRVVENTTPTLSLTSEQLQHSIKQLPMPAELSFLAGLCKDLSQTLLEVAYFSEMAHENAEEFYRTLNDAELKNIYMFGKNIVPILRQVVYFLGLDNA